MGKFLAISLLDGSQIIYETLTGITWRTERLNGRHSGLAIVASNFMFELSKEGLEHRLINLIEQKKMKLHEEYIEARGGFDGQSTDKQQSMNKSKLISNNGRALQTKKNSTLRMQTVPEADAPEEESEYRRTMLKSIYNEPPDDEERH